MTRFSALTDECVAVLVLALALIGAGCGLAPASPEEIHSALQESLSASGSATTDHRTQYFGTSYRTSLAWELELNLENGSRFPITFGNDLVLVEADSSGGVYDGILVVFDPDGTMPRLEDTDADDMVSVKNASLFSLSNAEVRYGDGGSSFLRGSTIGINFSESRSGPADETEGFGGLEPGETRTMEEDLEVGAWLRSEHRASLRLVLPELIVDRGGGEPARLRWVLYFKQPDDDSEEWVVNRQEVVLLDPVQLEQQLIVPETNQVSRVLAANWLADLDPDRARGALTQVGRGLREGDLLAVCLGLLTRLEHDGLGEHALSLLTDADAPVGIRRASATYLGVTRYQPALGALTEAVGDEEDAVAMAAITGLSSFSGPEGSAALLELLRGDAGQKYTETLFRSLASTRQRDALDELEKRARDGDDRALNALVGEGAPESFSFFVELARSGADPDDRGVLARGLTRSGGERAGELLLDWLAEESIGDERYPLATSTVVDEVAGLSMPSLVPRLVELADNGHLPAVQALSRYEDPSARKPLERLAREVEGPARVIVLDGLSERWPEGNEALFEEVLREPDGDLISPAVDALLKTEPDALPPLLLPHVASDDETIRRIAASTLGRCDPGASADGYLAAFLDTTDDQVAAALVSGLTDHDWKDDGAVTDLARKLEETAEDDLRFQVIRLLRHLSGDEMGPESYGEFWDEPDEWTRRWQEWAAQHAAS